MEDFLTRAVADIPSMKGVFITAMPDCLLFASWVRNNEALPVEDLAAYFGDLIRSNRRALSSLGAWTQEMQVTVEAAQTLIVLREVTADFVCGALFDRDTPLGMVRLSMRRLIERVGAHLPQVSATERPRGVRLMEFLDRYAPDPHTLGMRLSLRTGLTAEQLRAPATLSAEQVTVLEEAACKLLGVAKIDL
jgi:predicted regulator of Ras-like GTPase activity (Roadblock/LC7/MglB family)